MFIKPQIFYAFIACEQFISCGRTFLFNGFHQSSSDALSLRFGVNNQPPDIGSITIYRRPHRTYDIAVVACRFQEYTFFIFLPYFAYRLR